MKRSIVLSLFVLLFTLQAVAETEIFSFQAFAIVDHSRLEWATGQETNLRTFIIERSSDGRQFMAIGQLPATGSFSHYEFLDSSPLDAGRERIFYYRLRMVNRDGGVSYSGTESVSLSFSAVQQTWGSIKAMFR